MRYPVQGGSQMLMQGQLPSHPQLAMQLAGLPTNDSLPQSILQSNGGAQAFMSDVGPTGMTPMFMQGQHGGMSMQHHDMMLGHQPY